MPIVLKTRASRWDNLKCWLIFCVVFGHFSYHFVNQSDFLKGIYTFIYLFHMPTFIFVSGLFSKTIINKKQWDRVFSYFMLYTIMKFLEQLFELFTHKVSDYHFFWSSGPSWYAFAVFVFLILTIYLKDINPKYLITMAFVVGLFAGLDNHLGAHYVSMRICVFYPFFLLGYFAEKEDFKNFSKKQKTIALTIILVFLLLSLLLGSRYFGLINLWKGKVPYESLHLSAFSGIIARLIAYLVSSCLLWSFVVIMPNKTLPITYIGERTLAVYVWHICFFNLFFRIFGKKLIMHLFPTTYMFILLPIVLLMIVFCANPLLNRITREILSPKKFLCQNE